MLSEQCSKPVFIDDEFVDYTTVLSIGDYHNPLWEARSQPVRVKQISKNTLVDWLSLGKFQYLPWLIGNF